ncbi:hypothetical protein B0T25DRAFT_231118 [Lasiosphaeria hispida]|uniref:Uncharacterized protein n=1 Tax=Lasiosphaeria hispida TaxID=260671 RepID=A0AAJ0MC70_9PEZI|nr:hypothetical protein B0T25DRAFT_231118 [Lasiosphaeria hispida]
MDWCEKTHSTCARMRRELPLPKRVVLNEPRGVLPYAILSYCWGSSVPLKTTVTSANIGQHIKNRIPLDKFPKRLRDVIPFQPHRISGNDQNSKISPLRSLSDWVPFVSNRLYSLPNDKLPSLVGLVSQLAKATSASYVAGLWREDLLVGLTWRAQTVGLCKRSGRAPSWSWASFDDL